jgi:Lon protease-like protein
VGLIPNVIHRVPVFALEDYVLLPYTVAALQVFEPSARHMVDDCEATNRLLVIAGLQRGWREAEGTPAVEPVAGLGKVMNVRPLEDGTREVFVHGMARVRLLELERERPYRVATVQRLDDGEERHDRRRVRAALRRLHDYLNGLVRVGRVGADVSRVIAGSDDPAILSFRLGAVLIPSPVGRQRLLELRSAADRLDVLVEAVAALLMDDRTPAASDVAPGAEDAVGAGRVLN